MRIIRIPMVTIGLPVYNGERYLPECLDSLLAQSFGDFELIISDNASTDGTEAICRTFAANDPRIRYFRAPENRGAAANINRVVHLASAPYFHWAFHDDVHGPPFLERCLSVLDEDSSAVLCYARPVAIGEEGGVLRRLSTGPDATSDRPSDRFGHVLAKQSWCLQLFGVVRTSVLRRTRLHGSFPGADHVLIVELSLHGRFESMDEDLFFSRDHSGRSTRSSGRLRQRWGWLDPSKARRTSFSTWAQLSGHLSAIARTPLPARERALCHKHLGGWLHHNAMPLAADLVIGVAGESGDRVLAPLSRVRAPGAPGNVEPGSFQGTLHYSDLMQP